MSEDERYRKVIELWGKATDDVTNKLMSSTMPPVFQSVHPPSVCGGGDAGHAPVRYAQSVFL